MSHLNVKEIGSPDFPRYVIVKRSGQVFTGDDWSIQKSRALLYHDAEEVQSDCIAMIDLIRPRTFVAKLKLIVTSADNLTPDEIRDYVRHNLRMHVRRLPGHKCAYADISTGIAWKELKELNVE